MFPEISLSSRRNSGKNGRDAYWDGGPAKIHAFEEQHGRVCDDNWICQKLDLKNLVVEEAPNESRRDCLKIANILG